jgi:hypothetical protein
MRFELETTVYCINVCIISLYLYPLRIKEKQRIQVNKWRHYDRTSLVLMQNNKWRHFDRCSLVLMQNLLMRSSVHTFESAENFLSWSCPILDVAVTFRRGLEVVITLSELIIIIMCTCENRNKISRFGVIHARSHKITTLVNVQQIKSWLYLQNHRKDATSLRKRVMTSAMLSVDRSALSLTLSTTCQYKSWNIIQLSIWTRICHC